MMGPPHWQAMFVVTESGPHHTLTGAAMQQIVVGVDGSPQADRALRWAVHEAELRLATLNVVHCYVVHARGLVVHVPDHDLAEERLDEIIERNRDVLDLVKWTAETMGVVSAPSAGLVDAAEDADMIVLGSRGAGGFKHLRLGSTGYRTAAHATAPVVVVHDGGEDAEDARRPVVVGVDGSRAATRALRWAAAEAARRDVTLTVAHASAAGVDAVLARSPSGQQRQRALTRARDEADAVVSGMLDEVDVPDGIQIERVVERGSPADVLLTHAGPEHLLVVGTRGHGALGRLVFGSVSHQCLHHATGPVVVVP